MRRRNVLRKQMLRAAAVGTGIFLAVSVPTMTSMAIDAGMGTVIDPSAGENETETEETPTEPTTETPTTTVPETAPTDPSPTTETDSVPSPEAPADPTIEAPTTTAPETVRRSGGGGGGGSSFVGARAAVPVPGIQWGDPSGDQVGPGVQSVDTVNPENQDALPQEGATAPENIAAVNEPGNGPGAVLGESRTPEVKGSSRKSVKTADPGALHAYGLFSGLSAALMGVYWKRRRK